MEKIITEADIAEATMKAIARLKRQSDRMTLAEQLALHEKWVYAEPGGVQFEDHGTGLIEEDLSGADLTGADLTGADLR